MIYKLKANLSIFGENQLCIKFLAGFCCKTLQFGGPPLCKKVFYILLCQLLAADSAVDGEFTAGSPAYALIIPEFILLNR